MFGKAIISPNYIGTTLQFIKTKSEIKTKLDTFTPIIKKINMQILFFLYLCLI